MSRAPAVDSSHGSSHRDHALAPDVVTRSAGTAASHDIQLAAACELPVLITGPPGSGCIELARLIHDGSRVRDLPFVYIYWSDVMEEALTDLVSTAWAGRREESSSLAGTVCLGLHEPAPREQAALYGLLETLHAQMRVICAAPADLPEQVRAGRFCDRLFYRLNAVHLTTAASHDREGASTG